MKTILPYMLALGLIWAAVLSCKKSVTTTKSTTDYLIQGSWKFSAAGFDSNKDGTIDIADNSWPACRKDNLYTFKAGGSGIMDEGASLCTVGDPQTANFSWSLSGSASLTIVGSAIAGNGIIQTCNDNLLSVYKDTTVSSVAVRYVINFSH
jgi:hypothetical protein